MQNVRAAAAKTLGRLKYKKALPQLVQALKDEEWVCFSALESLTDIKEESTVDHILELLKSPSETTRFAAIESLGKLGSSRAVQPLVDHIPDADDFEKRSIIKSLVQIGSIPTVGGSSDVLLSMLSEEDWDEKLVAIKGLALISHEEVIPRLIDLAGALDMSEPFNEDRIFVIKDAIESFGCCEHLLNVLKDDSIKFRGRVIAIDIIGNLKCKNAVPKLISLLKSEYRDVRRSSITSLGKIDSIDSRKSLLDAIADQDSHVRKTAAAALGNIRDKNAFEPLMTMLQKEEYNDVIDTFIEALININPELFQSNIHNSKDHIQARAAKYTSGFNSEVSC